MKKNEEIKQVIIDYAKENFFKAGFAHVTTDDIAADLGISKKTLYKYFSSKKKLVETVVEKFADESTRSVEKVLYDRRMDFVLKIKKMMAVINEIYSNITEPFARDLKKNMPAFYKEMIERRRKVTSEQFGALVREGVKKRIFRKDFNSEIVLLAYIHTMQNIIVPETITRMGLPAAEIFEMLYRIIHEGILTEKARKKYHA